MVRPKKDRDSIFEETARRLRDLAVAEARHARHVSRQCDWDDPADRSIHISGKRMEERLAFRKKHVPDGKCPVCRKKELNYLSWVHVKGGKGAVIELPADDGEMRRKKVFCICKSCWTVHVRNPMLAKEGRLELIEIKRMIAVCDETDRYELVGLALFDAIQKAGMSQAHFSRRAGWTATYTHKLCSGSVKTIGRETMMVIATVLLEGGVTFDLPHLDLKAMLAEAERKLDQLDSTESGSIG